MIDQQFINNLLKYLIYNKTNIGIESMYAETSCPQMHNYEEIE